MLAALDVWDDLIPRDPARQMAVDEALLTGAFLRRPLLRHYRWNGLAASFGVAQRFADARSEAPGHTLVRRWTGGGVVRHDADWTFSLLIPAADPGAALRPADSYRHIHAAVTHALKHHSRLALPGEVRQGLSCFQAPAADDVMDAEGVKLCGGAQRRTRQGLLHQGSIQNTQPDDQFLHRFAGLLAAEVHLWTVHPRIESEARRLATEKYGTAAWTCRR